MTEWNISVGNTGTVFVDGVMSGVDNDVGTIRYGGTIISVSGRWQTDPLTLGQSRYITVASGASGITGIISSGAFNSGVQVIRGVTEVIAGVISGIHKYGSSNPGKDFSIKKRLVMTAYYYGQAIRENSWNMFSGVFNPPVTVLNSGGWNISGNSDDSNDMSNTDQALSGVTFQQGGGSPVNTGDLGDD